MKSWIDNLSPELFWDVSQEKINLKQHEKWLLERVLQRGRWEDWLLVREHYGKDRLRGLLPGLRLDSKAENFLKLYCRL